MYRAHLHRTWISTPVQRVMCIPWGDTTGFCSQHDKISDRLKAACTSTRDPWVALNPDRPHSEFCINPLVEIHADVSLSLILPG